MGKFVLVLSAGTTVVVFGLLLVASRLTKDADDELNVYVDKSFAREAAATGMNLALGKLGRDTTAWAASPANFEFPTTTYNKTSFEVDVRADYAPTLRTGKCNIDTVDVVSTGHSREVDHVIEATIVRTCSEKAGAPGSKTAMASEMQFKINGESAVFSSDPTKNANLHSNDELYVNGTPVVEGYGTYTGSYFCDTCAGFVPNDDVNGSDPNVYYADSVHIPTFVAADYWPQRTYDQANVYLDGTGSELVIDFTNYKGITGYGTAQNPFLWYIQGDLEVAGDIRFNGFAMIVVEGHVHIGGDATILSSVAADAPPPPRSTVDSPNKTAVRQWIAENVVNDVTLGIYVEGSKDDKPDEAGIHINSNAVIAGQMFANHKIHINGDATVFGGIVTKHLMDMNGKNVTWYTSLNESVNLFGKNITLPNGIRLIAYAEW